MTSGDSAWGIREALEVPDDLQLGRVREVGHGGLQDPPQGRPKSDQLGLVWMAQQIPQQPSQ